MNDTDKKAIELHKQWKGKIDTTSKASVKTREDLAIAYTPGVAAPCRIIHENVEEAYTYTIKQNTVILRIQLRIHILTLSMLKIIRISFLPKRKNTTKLRNNFKIYGR